MTRQPVFVQQSFTCLQAGRVAITLIDTALRVGEIAGIRDSDIDWDGNIIKVYSKKKDQHVVFNNNLVGELHKWIRRKNEFALQLKRGLLSKRTYETMDTTITFPALGLNGCRWGPLTANAISQMIAEHALPNGLGDKKSRSSWASCTTSESIALTCF